MSAFTGSPAFPFSAMVRNTIAEHGLQWAVRYYCAPRKGKPAALTAREFRIFAGI